MRVSRWILLTSFVVALMLMFRILSKSDDLVAKTFVDLRRNNSQKDFDPADVIFKTKPLVLWVMDQHVTPVKDIKNLLPSLGVKIIDKNLDHFRCKHDECLPGPRIINARNIDALNVGIMRSFYEAYKDDPEMRSVDAFVCFHMASVCEVYIPFNKSIIIISTHRYELGRHQSRARWIEYNRVLTTMASNPRNFIGANNLYDANYIKYFTGIEVTHVPSACDYMVDMYDQSRKGFLVHRNRDLGGFLKIFFEEVNITCQLINCSVELFTIKDRYPGQLYKHSDFAAHQGVVAIPQQVSTMHMFELYRQNIPMFVPTKELLVEWDYKHDIMWERISPATGRFGKDFINGSLVEPHPSQTRIQDPNSKRDLDSIRHWLQFVDFYLWPHVVYFDSILDLVVKLERLTSEDLWKISAAMKKHNMESRDEILVQWRDILENVAKYSTNRPR